MCRSYDARNSSLYGSRLHLVSADCNELPDLVSPVHYNIMHLICCLYTFDAVSITPLIMKRCQFWLYLVFGKYL